MKKLGAKDVIKMIGTHPIQFGLVLGSGLGNILPLQKFKAFEYSDLLGFSEPSVTGHQGKLIIGSINKTRVAVLSGRTHFYESGKSDTMRGPIKFLAELGISRLLLTNAAGSLQDNIPTGSFMVIKDHINFSGLNPLIGEKSEARFLNLTSAYDKPIMKKILKAGKENNIATVSAFFLPSSFLCL